MEDFVYFLLSLLVPFTAQIFLTDSCTSLTTATLCQQFQDRMASSEADSSRVALLYYCSASRSKFASQRSFFFLLLVNE
ncbi:uncharacterized protein BO95DRAFT_169574 [Aspergillus brunneoviolaceus CBS 621.78]|uniref:Uncharacterized protein n=1 Tax=Aspergillus brunneoviolaceus CBS 621.78 TaxID=1450534 RepID=A0ACD1G681_9EURO|nr:hypothetical protein BO95DRAFT_169574 [Aspergillus brunneoviolaceus CBS 621.78]RAH44739.1 hypothetical protein BO95DRAFT_169574 [Aspergillus brunneoviolaceus CBS 621.78]